MKRARLLLSCIALLFFQTLFAQEKPPYPTRKYFTQRIAEKPPVIDAVFDEECWDQVEWGQDYTQSDPYEGIDPSQETAFKILYDDKNLYIAYQCFDTEPEKIENRMSRRDNFPGDWVEINIDSYHDLRTAFSFTISVSGVKGDEFISNDGRNWDTNWNPIWYAKTRIDETGWKAEVKIPLSQLRFANKEEHVWGIQSTRRFFRAEERSLWQPVRQNDPSWVGRFGELHGIKGIKPQTQIELQPYLLAQAESFEKEEGNPFATGSDTKLSGGLDGKIGVTSDLTLDFTINPDFGQVEADPSRLTLDGFRIFFEERRPFFIENRNIFNYRLTGSQTDADFDGDLLFYSRRIGGAPHHYAAGDSDNGIYTTQPDNTTILGAAKFSGKTQKGLSIGILESITQREMADIDNNGESSEQVVEPLTNYFVGRIQQDFDEGNTVVGGVFTAVNRKIDDPSLEFLHKSAYSGGLDILHRWKERSWYVGGNFFFSNVAGTTEAITNTQESFEHFFQRPDADHLEVDTTATSLFGHGGNVRIGKNGGRWGFETGVTWRSPELELNDIGFLRNTDEINHWTWAGYRWLKPFSIFRTIRLNYNHWSRWDYGGNNIYRAFNTNAHFRFKDFSGMGTGFFYDNLEISNNWLRGGPSYQKPNGVATFFYGFTNENAKVVLNWNSFFAWGFEKSVKIMNYTLGMSVQPSNALRITIRPSYNIFKRVDQYVTQTELANETRYVLGEVDQRTFSTTIRLNYNITPDLTIQYYGQPFISRGRYKNFRYITDSRASEYYDRHALYTDDQITYDEIAELYSVDENRDKAPDFTFGDPDFSFIQFRSNLVARWEYIPGSEIFLVWSQSTNAFEDPSLNLLPSLFDNLFDNKPHNIFLLKVTYRWLK